MPWLSRKAVSFALIFASLAGPPLSTAEMKVTGGNAASVEREQGHRDAPYQNSLKGMSAPLAHRREPISPSFPLLKVMDAQVLPRPQAPTLSDKMDRLLEGLAQKDEFGKVDEYWLGSDDEGAFARHQAHRHMAASGDKHAFVKELSRRMRHQAPPPT